MNSETMAKLKADSLSPAAGSAGDDAIGAQSASDEAIRARSGSDGASHESPSGGPVPIDPCGTGFQPVENAGRGSLEFQAKRAFDIFSAALELDPGEMPAFVREACVDDPMVRAEVERLLAKHREAQGRGIFADRLTLNVKALLDDPLVGQSVEHYRIEAVLGEGGMGTVYRAEQSEPIHRTVALKIIKLGMDTRQTLARFETEREALSLMDHPNVARVLDAGATDAGRPFFVMEYVDGIPITTYCDRKRLSNKLRIKLFIDVCAAVQHAHQKGIIHRDIKPSNVLITEVDGKPVPKVIDFGIAKATQQQSPDQTKFTETGQLVGTPAYMSPEQAGANPVDRPTGSLADENTRNPSDIDTRTDVYSLGVLLYELLSGSMPFDDTVLRHAGHAELQRIIREVDPPKPSVRLKEATKRRSDEATKGKSDDAMRESRPRAEATGPSMARPSRSGLASDRQPENTGYAGMTPPLPDGRGSKVGRGSPGDAPPPSVASPLRRFVASSAIAHLRRTDPKSLLRELRGDLDWVVMKCLEKDRTRRYETPNALATELQRFLNNEPVTAGPPSAFYRLKKFTRRNRGSVAAAICIFAALATGLALSDLQRRRAIRAEVLAATRLEDAETARQEAQSGRDEAEQVSQFLSDILAAADPNEQGKDVLLRDVLAKAEEAIGIKFGNKPLVEARLRHTLGWTYRGLGLLEDAEQQLLVAASTYTATLGPNAPDTLSAKNAYASVILDRGHYSQSESALRSTIEIQRRVQGEEHPNTLVAVNNLALSVLYQGRYGEAEELFRKTLEIQRRILGEKHADALSSMDNLAICLARLGRYAEATELSLKCLEHLQSTLGDEHPDTLLCMSNLESILYLQGRYAEADEMCRQVVEIRRHVLGAEHPSTLISLNNIARNLENQGRYVAAEQLDREVLEVRRRVLGEEHPDTLLSMNNLAIDLYKQTRFREAEELNRKTMDARLHTLGAEHPDTLWSMHTLAANLSAQARYAEAERLFRQTLVIRQRRLGNDHLEVARTMSALAGLLVEAARWEEAEPLCRNADSILAQRLPPNHRDRQQNANLLGRILSGLRRFAEAETLLTDTYERLRSDPGLHPIVKKTMVQGIVRLYDSWDAVEPGMGYAEKAAEWRAKLDALGTEALRHEHTEEEEAVQSSSPDTAEVEEKATVPIESAPLRP